MNADQFNALYPVGSPVVAYPGVRPEDDPKGERLVTRTRSKAEVLGGHTDVVWVDGHSACIALTHVDPVAVCRRGEPERDPIPLRWGLNDVEWVDDDSTIVLLSGPDREPYMLELEPSQASVLRDDLAGPEGPAVFRAAWDTEPLGPLYGGEEAARAHCEHDARLDYADGIRLVWRVFEESVAELYAVIAGEESPSGYTVTRLSVAGAHVPDDETGGA